MKVAIITDQHFGARKGSKYLHDYFEKFYNDVFFPYLEENKITTVVDMGDTFDNRRNIDLWSLEWAKEKYFNKLRDLGIKVHTIVGNHTAYYKDTNSINSVDLLLNEYENVIVYSEPTEIKLGKLKVLLLPWINSENYENTKNSIQKSTSKVVMGHLELNGFRATRGHMMEDGMDVDMFDKFERVYSGHFHTRSTNGKIFYLGNPYEMFWNDVNDTRGFTIFDTQTLEHTPIDNPHRLFYNIYYDDTNYKLFNGTDYQDKIVKVIVKKKTNQKQFEKFIDKLYSASVRVHELKIVENFNIQDDEDFEVTETENTISILNRYIDEAEFDCDKSIIKGILQKIYAEACEVE
jgi:DNA repair exonuclease SbcCD nuclease subunit